jgi:hypothetical protein
MTASKRRFAPTLEAVRTLDAAPESPFRRRSTFTMQI